MDLRYHSLLGANSTQMSHTAVTLPWQNLLCLAAVMTYCAAMTRPRKLELVQIAGYVTAKGSHVDIALQSDSYCFGVWYWNNVDNILHSHRKR